MSKQFSLSEHLQQEHQMSPFQTYLKEIVYGGSDGIVTTFAVVAGFTGAASNAVSASNSSAVTTYSFLTVLLFGFANLLADATSMGLGNFLSLRSEKDMYKTHEAKELHEIRSNPKMEREETIAILAQKGFTNDQAVKLAEIYKTNESYWLSFMMNHELQLSNPKGEIPLYTALATFLAFTVFGIIPLLPYIILKHADGVFPYSLFATFTALTLLGILRWKVTAESISRSVGEIVLLGSISAIVAFAVGTFFR